MNSNWSDQTIFLFFIKKNTRGNIHGCDYNRREFSWEVIRSAFNCEVFLVGRTKGLAFLYVITFTPWVVDHETYTPVFFPERSLFVSARWTENPTGCTDSDSIFRESHVSVKQSMLQSLMSLWKEILALSSSILLSRDWTLASYCAYLEAVGGVRVPHESD